jgi:hypothetical protein
METSAAPLQRPVFLTILCVLTFLGSSWGIISSLTSYNNAEVQAMMAKQMIDQQKEEAMDKAATVQQRNLMKKMFSGTDQLMDTRKIKQNSLFMLMSNVLTLIGGIMMYRLRRTGFGVYLLGIAVYIAAPLLIYGSGGFFGVMMTLLLAFIGIIFAILYALNIKHMK